MAEVAKGQYDLYKKVNVETASQGKLIVMLFSGAVQRAERAKTMLERGKYEAVHNNLMRAQDIIGELRGALNMQAGDLASNLDRVYEYLQHLLMKANIRKEPSPIDECIQLMVQLRDTWEELFQNAPTEESAPAPTHNQHGNSLINIQG
jgi:flagellar protein FliS